MRKFDKSKRGGLIYTLYHWLAFQKTAFKYRCWRPRFLFHDVCKPLLRLLFPYYIVQYVHRHLSRHHLEYIDHHSINDVDWLGLVIDWECSPLTKIDSQEYTMEKLTDIKESDPELYDLIAPHIMSALHRLYGRKKVA